MVKEHTEQDRKPEGKEWGPFVLLARSGTYWGTSECAILY